MITTSLSLSARVYGLFLVLFPRSFRAQFSYELMCDFSDGTDRAWRRGGWPSVTRVLVTYAEDFVRNLIIQWFRTGVPTLIGISVSSTILLVVLLALQGIPQSNPLFAPLHLVWLASALALILLSILIARYHGRRSM